MDPDVENVLERLRESAASDRIERVVEPRDELELVARVVVPGRGIADSMGTDTNSSSDHRRGGGTVFRERDARPTATSSG